MGTAIPVDCPGETSVVSVALQFVEDLNKPRANKPRANKTRANKPCASAARSKEMYAMNSASLVRSACGDTSPATACWPGRTGTP